MNFPLTFKLLISPNSQHIALFGIISTSVETHQKSFAKFDQSKFNDKGKFGNN